MGDDLVDKVMEESEKSRLNMWIAVLVSIIATLMAVGKVKDDNLVQAMERVNMDKVDEWAYYQAKSTKQHIIETMVDQMSLSLSTTPIASEGQAGILFHRMDQ